MIQTQDLIYQGASSTFQGKIAWDDEISGKRPTVMVVHTFRGQTDFENDKAIALAKMGYLGFAIDVYGQGRRATTHEEASALMAELNNDRKRLLEHMKVSLETAKNLKWADETQMGAIGFCFGGKCVLDLARSGEDIGGVASFHGVYDRPSLAHSQPIKAKILLLHGWDDPLADPETTLALAKELTERGANWELDAYGHTGHAFTNRQASNKEGGMFFQEQSDRRAWTRMKNFFEEIFDKNSPK